MKPSAETTSSVVFNLPSADTIRMLQAASAELDKGEIATLHARLQGEEDFTLLWPVIAQRCGDGDDTTVTALCAPWINGARVASSEYVACATSLVVRKRYEQALAVVDRGIERAPGLADLHALRGDALRGLNRYATAAKSYEACVAIDDRHARALVNLSGIRLQLGQADAAERIARQALAADPESADAGVNLGRALIEQGEIAAAMEAFADVAERTTPNAILCTSIARGWRAAGDVMQATAWLERALQQEPDHVPALVVLGGLAREMGDLESGLTQLNRATSLDASNYEAWAETALVLLDRGDAPGALAAQERARALAADLPAAISGYANTLVAVGEMRAAFDNFKAALEVNPMSVAALCGIALHFPRRLDRTHRERIETLLALPAFRPQARSRLHAALASYFDALGDYPRAAVQTDLANEAQWQHRSAIGWNYDPAAFEVECDDLIDAFSADTFARLRGLGNESEAPVFIVGMPRSGTTLLEQILAAHPNIVGVGERSHAMLSWSAVCRDGDAVRTVGNLDGEQIGLSARLHLERLLQMKPDGRDARYFVDKLPDNFRMLGWIALQFPNARVIDLRRDARDVLVSCWMKQFNQLQWSVRPDWIAHRVLQYRRLMSHWSRVLPLRMLRVDYEALAAAPEQVAREITSFLDLPWDPSCLDFHQARRAVRTASVAQVREPVHARSVARWKHYESHLSEAFARLGDA